MINFVIRILVYALALAVTVIFTPGLLIEPLIPGVIDISATYLIYGVVFGFINALIRPLVLLFTARLLVRTMGLFAIVLNTFLFWLLSLVFPNSFVIDSPALLWIAWGSMVMALVLMIMEAFFGLDMPAFKSQIETQFYWRWVGYLSSGRRNMIAENLRTAQIMDIITRYTQDIAVDMTPLAKFRTFMQGLLFRGIDPMSNLTLPEKVRYMLQELGPTFVKFGQIVSSRSANLPPEWKEQMDLLQSNVPPFSYQRAHSVVEDELKDTPENLFASFDHEPFAAASTAQVHRAVMHDGTPVVVKIQRPNIDVTVKADINVIFDLTKGIQKRQEWAKNIDLHGLVDEFGQSILYELDYRNEASNINLLARNMASIEGIHVPAEYGGLSSKKVLTMQYLPGVKITDVTRIKEAGLDPQAIAQVFVFAMVKQILFDGFFHADPHPGNVLVNLDDGSVGFLDMGLMGELNRNQRMALGDILLSMVEADGYSLGKAALRLSRPLPGVVVDEPAFLEAMERFADRFLGSTADMGYVVDALQDTLQRYGLRLDPNFTLAFKSLMQADEIIRTLEPTMALSTAAVESSSVLLRESITTDALAKTVRTQITRSSREVVYRIPSLVEATTKWLDQYEQGRISVHVDTSDLSPQVDKLDKALSKSLDRLLIGLVLAGWLVGAAVASTISINIMGYPLSDLAFYMFLIGAIVGAYVVVTAIIRLNKNKDPE